MLLMAALLSACVPKLKAPPAQIASLHIATAGHAAACCVARSWWTQWGDAELNRLVAMALADNPGLAASHARVEAAQAEVLRADARRVVHVESRDRVTRLHNAWNADRAIYNGQTYTLGSIDPLQLSYHWDLWGQDRELIAIAGARAERARARHDLSVLLLSSAVIKTYFAWQTAGRLLEEQEGLVRLAEEARQIKALAVRSGIAPEAEQVAEQADLDRALAQQSLLRQRHQALHYALLALLGQAPDAQVLPTRMAPQLLPAAPALPATLGLEALSLRPDVRMALWQARAALHRVKLAKTAYYPNINLYALAGVSSIELSQLFKSRSATYAFGPALSLPLFEGGALDAQLQAQAARYAAAIDAYNKTVLDAAAQVAKDLAHLDNSQHKLVDIRQAREQADQLVTIADAGYRSGVSDRYHRVQAQARQIDAQMDEQTQGLNWLYAITDIESDLGGGQKP